MQQTVDTVTTNYTLDLNNGLTQVLTDGTDTYLYGLGRIGEYDSANWTYPLPDALGSVRQLVDASGAPVMAQSYAPYGDVQESYGAESSNYGFAGEWTDGTGLQHLRARYLNTGIGRFISRDTWGGDYRRPLSLNRWGYVEGNPVNRVDPSGECAWCIVAGVLVFIASGCSNQPPTFNDKLAILEEQMKNARESGRSEKYQKAIDFAISAFNINTQLNTKYVGDALTIVNLDTGEIKGAVATMDPHMGVRIGELGFIFTDGTPRSPGFLVLALMHEHEVHANRQWNEGRLYIFGLGNYGHAFNEFEADLFELTLADSYQLTEREKEEIWNNYHHHWGKLPTWLQEEIVKPGFDFSTFPILVDPDTKEPFPTVRKP